MKAIFEFFKHNNARLGNTFSICVLWGASEGYIPLKVLGLIVPVATMWGVGSWTQGAKNGFKPKPPGAE